MNGWDIIPDAVDCKDNGRKSAFFGWHYPINIMCTCVGNDSFWVRDSGQPYIIYIIHGFRSTVVVMHGLQQILVEFVHTRSRKVSILSYPQRKIVQFLKWQPPVLASNFVDMLQFSYIQSQTWQRIDKPTFCNEAQYGQNAIVHFPIDKKQELASATH